MSQFTKNQQRAEQERQERAQDLAVYTAGAITSVLIRHYEVDGSTMPVEQIADAIDATLIMCGYRPIAIAEREKMN